MLHLHRADRADRLADALANILAQPPGDPFTPEVIAVPTRGMERWLTQRLSGHLGTGHHTDDGVCANVEFPFPGRLIGAALAAASGIAPHDDLWTAERLVWPLIATVDSCLDEPWLAPLASHLNSAPERRYPRVRGLARLYDAYAFRRPELILSWCQGEGEGWQPELWRRLRQRIATPSGPERLAGACARITAEPDLLDLPERLLVFGLTRLPASYLQALHALGARRDVHLFLLHPSPALWDKVARQRPPTPLARALDPTARLPANRLLASWGRDSRELQVVLDTAGEDHHHGDDVAGPQAGRTPPSLLGRLQADVRADRPPAPVTFPADDDSVRIHACHGRQRQVEVLREAILHRLARDPTLEPRDVIVMCPDIETFAPLIQSAFGTGPAAEPDDDLGELAPTDLRVRLADRSLRQTNSLLGALARLLELPNARLTASQVLDLADTEPVRRRFGLDDDDLARLQDWIVAGAIHWGLDAAHRSPFKLDGLESGTWAAGIRRLLLGVTMSESGQRLFGRVLPIDDVESGAIELAGRLAELVDRLEAALDRLAGPHTVPGWAAALGAAADALLAAPDREAWQRQALARLLEDLVAQAGDTGATLELTLPEIRALIGDRLEGRPTRANFRTGHLTICTLHPMRSVPHRVVALLGLDDGAFPRRMPRNGDDLLLADPQVGERDPRSEDRQMLLDALMSAQEALIVTYSGNDERTNAPRPPAVPVGELLDAVEALDPSARERVLVRHPLQPFDQANFEPGRFRREGPWSFDRVALAGALALRGQRNQRPPFLAAPLPPHAEESVALADLVSFVQRPVRAFLRQRLGISAVSYEDEVQDVLPVALDHLELWQVGQRLLEGVLAGAQPRDCALAEIARGTLPPGALGEPVIREQVWPRVESILRHARAYGGSATPASLQANLRLGDGTRLTGTVSGVRDHVLLAVSYSRLNARHRLAAWVRLLALTAAHPDVAFEAVTVGRARRRGSDVSIAQIPPLGRDAATRAEVARGELAALLELRARGLREPLPLPCLTAAAYAEAIADPDQALVAAGREWTSDYDFDREDVEPDHELVFGGRLTLAELLALRAAEGSRFERLARELWEPLLAREGVSDL